MSNSVNLSLDVTKTGIQNPLIKVRQGDGGFETLRTTVTANGEPMDLQGWTITFMGTTAGNHKIVDGNVKLVEAPNGIFDYTPSKAWGMDIGEFKIAYFKFIKGDGAASSANFRVNVIEAVDLTKEEAQNYISVVDTTIAEINQHLTDSLANVTQSIAATSSAASSLSIKVSSAVNQVNSAASNASSVASSATSNINSVASSAASYIAINDAKLVHKTGTETIAGDKTFTSPINGQLAIEPENIFFNSEFENSGEGWGIVAGGGTFTVGTGDNNVSGHAVAAVKMTSGYLKFGNTRLYPTAGDTNYSLSSFINAGTTNNVYLIVDEFDENKNQIKSTPYGSVNSESWSLKTASFVTQTQTKFLRVVYQLNGQAGRVAYISAPMWNIGTSSLPYVRGSEIQAIPDDNNIVHKVGNETIAGDKTFTGTVNAAQKVYTRTIGSTADLQIIYTRVGNIVTGRYTAAKAGVFTLSNNDGYKAPTAYPVNVIAQNINAWFTTDNRFSAPDGASQGNFMFITSDPLPAN